MTYTITNTVIQIQIPYTINLLVLFKKVDEITKGTHNPYNIVAAKYKTFKTENANTKKAFKNAVHIDFLLDIRPISIKVFHNGLMHLSGLHNIKRISKYILQMMHFLNTYNTTYTMDICLTHNFITSSCGQYLIARNPDTNTFFIKGIKCEKDSLCYIISDANYTIKFDEKKGIFISDTHLRERTLYNNTLSQQATCQLSLIKRKNLPKEGTYYIENNELKLTYNNNIIGHFTVTDNLTNEDTVNIKTKITIHEKIFTPLSIKFSIEIHSLNISIYNEIFNHENLTVRNILQSFNELNLETNYNADKHQCIHCCVYVDSINGDIYYQDNPTLKLSPLKFQVLPQYNKMNNKHYQNKITMTCKNQKIISIMEKFLCALFQKVSNKEHALVCQPSCSIIPDNKTSIKELYTLMLWSESAV